MITSNDDDYKRIQAIFIKSLDLDAGGERDAYLDGACDGDERIRESLEALLKEYEVGGNEESASGGDPPTEREPAAMFLPGKILADRYRIVSLLGRGGMGEVYRADDLKLDQPVALKFLPAALAEDPSLRKALYNEVRQARLVAHRHVCRVYDIGEAEGLHFLSMEYIEGEHLGSLLRRIGRLPGGKAIELARQLCAGLEAAHEQSILHLDLKPANLMIDERGDLRVTDFGLARLVEEAESEKRRVGTPAYMAPEQLLEGITSQRSDIYAVGLILFEMFTGQRMHRARNAGDIAAWHQAGGSSQLGAQMVAGLDPGLADYILACTAPAPDGRPDSVGAVLSALEQLAPALASQHLQAETEPGAEVLAPESIVGSDVFIAYAAVDDKPLIAGKPGWIEQFHDHLQVRLEQLSGEALKIWRDTGQRTEDSSEQLLEFLPSAKTMVSVISPPFIKTPICIREVEEFWHSAERSGNLRVSDKTRILKVMKTPVPHGLAPPEVERLMGQLAGF